MNDAALFLHGLGDWDAHLDQCLRLMAAMAVHDEATVDRFHDREVVDGDNHSLRSDWKACRGAITWLKKGPHQSRSPGTARHVLWSVPFYLAGTGASWSLNTSSTRFGLRSNILS